MRPLASPCARLRNISLRVGGVGVRGWRGHRQLSCAIASRPGLPLSRLRTLKSSRPTAQIARLEMSERVRAGSPFPATDFMCGGMKSMGPGIRLGNTGVSSTHQLKRFLFFSSCLELVEKRHNNSENFKTWSN